MAKEFSIKNAKVEINGEDYSDRAHTWSVKTGIDGTMAVVSCHKLDGSKTLSLKKNPNPSLLLVDSCGAELRYVTELFRVKILEESGAVPQIDYTFKIIG